MMHVAEAGEAKGRVVLQLGGGRPSLHAIDAAVWLARAFQSEIEGLFVEDEQLIEMASYPFAREVSFSGRATRSLSTPDVERDLRHAFDAWRREVETRAHAAEIAVHARVVRGEAVRALAMACAERGPWNVVALAEPFTSPAMPSVGVLLRDVAGSTGLILVGPAVRRTSGPIVMAVETADRLPAMINAAERLAAVQEAETLVCLIGHDAAEIAELESHARLVLSERPDVRIETGHGACGSAAVVAETIRKLLPGLIIGQFGGLLVPDDGDLRPLAAALECPLLLVR